MITSSRPWMPVLTLEQKEWNTGIPLAIYLCYSHMVYNEYYEKINRKYFMVELVCLTVQLVFIWPVVYCWRTTQQQHTFDGCIPHNNYSENVIKNSKGIINHQKNKTFI